MQAPAEWRVQPIFLWGDSYNFNLTVPVLHKSKQPYPHILQIKVTVFSLWDILDTVFHNCQSFPNYVVEISVF